jgi:hypothetical protein
MRKILFLGLFLVGCLDESKIKSDYFVLPEDMPAWGYGVSGRSGRQMLSLMFFVRNGERFMSNERTHVVG